MKAGKFVTLVPMVADNHTIKCVSLNTSRLVRDVIVSLLEGTNIRNYSVESTTSTTQTYISPDSLTCPSSDSLSDDDYEFNYKLLDTSFGVCDYSITNSHYYFCESNLWYT